MECLDSIESLGPGVVGSQENGSSLGVVVLFRNHVGIG